MTVAATSFVAIANGHCSALRCCCHRRNGAGDRTDVKEGFFPEGSPRKPTWREEERVELQT
ncbi:Os06g0230300 [Oryza sativa Japonica Group]|nr:Os06g0230300 [Oryza sativa Japonica Group]|eukprot:NP_001174675.1 Os06g0230300 [Oryza sativa Japonica Group]